MTIHTDFWGGNIVVERVEGDTVYLERDLRDTEGDWFYWAFCIEGAAGRTLSFRFSSEARVGRFGAAVSHDLAAWHWSESGSGSSFSYTFAEDENKVYFAHHMLYHTERFGELCRRGNFVPEVFCRTERGRELPAVRIGEGDRWILMTARHHACESTGSYVLEGALDVLMEKLPAEYSVLVVPFIDYDGVIDGDQGKNRKPHDHNGDYIDAPVYEVVRRLIAFAEMHDLCYFFDFHSPWHMGSQNDRVFFSHSTEAMKPFVCAFGEYLKAETAGCEMKYTGAWDVGPNELWNNEKRLNSKNYFSRLDSVRLSVTMETPYFGVTDGTGKVSGEALRELGHAFGRSIIRYLNEH